MEIIRNKEIMKLKIRNLKLSRSERDPALAGEIRNMYKNIKKFTRFLGVLVLFLFGFFNYFNIANAARATGRCVEGDLSVHTARLYSSNNYDDDCMVLGVGTYESLWFSEAPNDETVGSVVVNGVKVVIFDESNFTGSPVLISADESYLNEDGGNNSIIVLDILSEDSFKINDGAETAVVGSTITLNFSVLGANWVKVSTGSGDSFVGEWIPYAPSMIFDVGPGLGTKTVYAKFRADANKDVDMAILTDTNGNSEISDTINIIEAPEQPAIEQPVVEGSNETPQVSSVVSALGGLNQFPGTSIQTLVGRAIQFASIGIIGSVALAMFVYAGLLWMFSRGNSEQAKKALLIMVWTSIGVTVTLASYSILKFIFGAVG